MLTEVQYNFIVGNDPAEKLKELEDRIWLAAYGPETSDLAERRAMLEADQRSAKERIEFLAAEISNFASGKSLRDSREHFVAQTRLMMREDFTSSVEREGCDGPTLERSVRSLGRKVFTACNAPVAPLVKKLAEDPFSMKHLENPGN